MNKYMNLESLANMTTGLCIFSMTPILLSLDGATLFGCIPWMMAALPIFIISIIWLFKSGDLVSGLATSILSGITLIGNAYSAMIELFIESNGISLTNQNLRSINISNGSVMLAASFILLLITFISLKKNILQAIFIFIACLGFVGIGLGDLGILYLGLFPGICLFIFAFWQIYSGMGIMVFHLTGEDRFPGLQLKS